MFTPRPLRRARGAHAAGRHGDLVMTGPPPLPADPPPSPPPADAAMRAMGCVASGSRRAAASYLTTLPPAELAAAGDAAESLAGLAAAVIRFQQQDTRPEPPPRFTLCLACQIGDCPGCSDPACAHYPPHHPETAEAAPEPDGADRSACD
jgi:hypothetical protein